MSKEIAKIENDTDKQIEFIEEMYGEQLSSHQRFFIKFMIENKDNINYFCYPYRNGRTMMKRFVERWKETFMNDGGKKLHDQENL